jgi:hypothetical protein
MAPGGLSSQMMCYGSRRWAGTWPSMCGGGQCLYLLLFQPVRVVQPGTALQKAKLHRQFEFFFSSVRKGCGAAQGLGSKSISALGTSLLASSHTEVSCVSG